MTEPKIHKRSEFPVADEPIKIGFIGHVGHGKTSVSAAIEYIASGKVSDPDPRDKIRGITLVTKPPRTHIGKQND